MTPSSHSPAVLIRAANPDDVPVLQELEREADTAAHWNSAHYASLFQTASLARRAWVVEAGAEPGPPWPAGATLGFLIARISPEWEIENIVVARRARRCGLGRALLHHCLAQAGDAGAAGVHLEVRESNTAARQLYERCGAVENGRRQAYYQQPAEDAITYVFNCYSSVKKID